MPMMAKPKVFYDKDADLTILKDKIIAVIGYGNQGRAQSLNMRDSGLKVIVGNRKDEYYDIAVRDGFEVYSIDRAVKLADVICFLIPDEVQPAVFEKYIRPNLKEGAVLDFASGYTVHFGFIEPPENIDVIMVAPKMIGASVRELYLKGTGCTSLVAVHQDYSGKALDYALALAKAIGSTRSGAILTTFEEEAVTDLFGEQVLAGGQLFLLRFVFDLLVSAGYNPYVVLLELYMSGEAAEEAKKIVRMGLFKQLSLHSPTSQYGQLTRGPRMINKQAQETLREILDEIVDGRFAKEWELEKKAGYVRMRILKRKALEHPLNRFEEELRKMVKIILPE